jgi:hypothetical protein
MNPNCISRGKQDFQDWLFLKQKNKDPLDHVNPVDPVRVLFACSAFSASLRRNDFVCACPVE